MSGNGNAVNKKVREWLRHADDDLRMARVAFKLKSAVPYTLIAYHAQQCAEKSLKAYLVFKKIDFPYSHLSSSSWSCSRRRPKEAMRAVSLAETVRRTVIKALAQEGLKIAARSK